MRKYLLIFILAGCFSNTYSQKVLVSWGQNTIENYTKDMYDAAQKLSPAELLTKNLEANSWSGVFLVLNASINNYAKETSYLKALAGQLTNRTETKLAGTSRLIIWERISSGDILFEGKGLVIENDLFRVAGRANQLLQSLAKKNFGTVTMQTSDQELAELQKKWIAFLSGQPVEEYQPVVYKNAKIPEISSPAAAQAMIISLQENARKNQLTKNCLKKIYNLDEMPKEEGSPARFCDPDNYTYSYLGLLFGTKVFSEIKDAKGWKDFWDTNQAKLAWNDELGIYEVKN